MSGEGVYPYVTRIEPATQPKPSGGCIFICYKDRMAWSHQLSHRAENGFGPLFASMLFAESSRRTGDTHTREQLSQDDVFAESPKRTGDTHSKQEEKQSMLFAEYSRRTGGTPTPGAEAESIDMWI